MSSERSFQPISDQPTLEEKSNCIPYLRVTSFAVGTATAGVSSTALCGGTHTAVSGMATSCGGPFLPVCMLLTGLASMFFGMYKPDPAATNLEEAYCSCCRGPQYENIGNTFTP